jgi:hypothetical protein
LARRSDPATVDAYLRAKREWKARGGDPLVSCLLFDELLPDQHPLTDEQKLTNLANMKDRREGRDWRLARDFGFACRDEYGLDADCTLALIERARELIESIRKKQGEADLERKKDEFRELFRSLQPTRSHPEGGSAEHD